MSNIIIQRQNEQQNIFMLAAQRYLYNLAKRLMAIQLILSIPFIILMSLINLCLKDQRFLGLFNKNMIDIAWLVATFGVIITFIDLVILSPFIERLKEKAANIQELFDCDVYDLPWNNVAIGKRPDIEDVIEYSNKYSETRKDPGYKSLINWYPKEIGKLPSKVARIVCQRCNMRWDAQLRKKISFGLGFLALSMFVILLIISTLGELSLKSFFEKVIAPCLPIWIFSVRYIQQNTKAIVSLEKLKQQAERAWHQALKLSISSTKLDEVARQLQDSLFLNRKNNPLVFDFIYKFYRPVQESSMNRSCETMVREYEEIGQK